MLRGMQCACLKGRRVRWIIRFQHLKGETVLYIIGLWQTVCCWFHCSAGDALRSTDQMCSREIWPQKYQLALILYLSTVDVKESNPKSLKINRNALTDFKELCLRPWTSPLATLHRRLVLLSCADPAGSALRIPSEGTRAPELGSYPCPWHAHPCTWEKKMETALLSQSLCRFSLFPDPLQAVGAVLLPPLQCNPHKWGSGAASNLSITSHSHHAALLPGALRGSAFQPVSGLHCRCSPCTSA